MPVSVQDTIFNHVGNGVTTTFAYGCQVPTLTDLEVYLDDVLQVSGFTVTGIGSLTGGTVIFGVAPANLAQIRLERVIELERTTDYQQNGDFLSKVVNPDFDRIWMALQGHLSVIKRAIQFPASDSSSISSTLPPAALRGNKALIFKPDGSVDVSADDYVNQAANAAASAAAAAASYDSFDDRWLGPKNSDPSLDNDGNPLLEGAAYWSTPDKTLKIWNVAANAWYAISSFLQAGVGAVLRTWQDKARDISSVLDWGSISTAHTASAVSAVQTAGGGTLLFPNGNYSGVTLPVNYGGVSLEYDGPNVPASLFGETAGSTFFGQRIQRYMGSSAHTGKSHVAYVIEHDAVGTGNSGADKADFGIGISMRKKGFGSGSAAAGEIDGGYIIARNDGSDSDTTALLFDVANYGIGFNALWEGATSAITGSTIVHRVSVQSGVIDTRTGDIDGHVLSKHNGVGGTAYFAQQGGGGDHTGKWQSLLRFRTDAGQLRFDMPVDSNDVVSWKLYDLSGNTKTLRCVSNSLVARNNADNADLATLTDAGDLTIAGKMTTGKAGLTAYTPTLRAASGSFTTASVTGHYHVLGTMCYVTIKVIITTAGTGTNPIVSLPFTLNGLTDGVTLVGRENAVNGKSVVAVNVTGTEVSLNNYDNTSPAVDGAVISITGMYAIN